MSLKLKVRVTSSSASIVLFHPTHLDPMTNEKYMRYIILISPVSKKFVDRSSNLNEIQQLVNLTLVL